MHGPEPSLVAGTSSGLCCQQCVLVNCKWQVHVVNTDLSRIDIVFLQIDKSVFMKATAVSALKIGELNDGKRRILRAQERAVTDLNRNGSGLLDSPGGRN